jgi:hypothetical protein
MGGEMVIGPRYLKEGNQPWGKLQGNCYTPTWSARGKPIHRPGRWLPATAHPLVGYGPGPVRCLFSVFCFFFRFLFFSFFFSVFFLILFFFLLFVQI